MIITPLSTPFVGFMEVELVGVTKVQSPNQALLYQAATPGFMQVLKIGLRNYKESHFSNRMCCTNNILQEFIWYNNFDICSYNSFVLLSWKMWNISKLHGILNKQNLMRV